MANVCRGKFRQTLGRGQVLRSWETGYRTRPERGENTHAEAVEGRFNTHQQGLAWSASLACVWFRRPDVTPGHGREEAMETTRLGLSVVPPDACCSSLAEKWVNIFVLENKNRSRW